MNTLKDYVDWKLANTDKLTDASGYPLMLEKCKLNKKMKEFKVYGNTVDDTSIGNLSKNLIWGSGTRTRDTCTTSCSGSVFTYDGACTANISYKSSMYDASQSIILKANTKYTFSIHYISGEFISGVNGLVIGLYSSARSWVVAPSRYVNTYQYTWSSTFTVQEDTSVSLNVIGWGEFDNLKMGVQLEESDAMTDYEPYGYKIPVVQRGKNLIDVKQMTSTALVANADGSYTISKNGGYRSSASFNISLPAGMRYSISADVIETSGATLRAIVHHTDGAGVYPTLGRIYTTKAEVVDCQVYLSSEDEDGSYVTFKNLMLNIYPDDTMYEPYVEPQTHNVYLDEPLSGTEYIDFKQKKVFREDASTEDIECTLPTLNAKTTVFTTDTTVQPSDMYAKYIKR